MYNIQIYIYTHHNSYCIDVHNTYRNMDQSIRADDRRFAAIQVACLQSLNRCAPKGDAMAALRSEQ